ncbi:MAG: CRISPR-associated helicase Cas3' [Eubacteriales bacterium]|nr:CRISPR-associated helicase Cas3' [Eubacteriales bacterium]
MTNKISYTGHINPQTKEIQPLLFHLENVRYLAKKNCPLKMLINIVCIASLLHDCGKLCSEFQAYMKEIMEFGDAVSKRFIDHSSAGGLIIENTAGNRLVSKVVGTMVYSHHGLYDCINLETGQTLSDKRREGNPEIEEVTDAFFQLYNKSEIINLMKAASRDLKAVYDDIEVELNKYAVKDGLEFYQGMYQRVLLSILIDSDWTDTACFSNGLPLPEGISQETRDAVWKDMIQSYELYMQRLNASGKASKLNQYRNEISKRCYQMAQKSESCYWLTVPTGAGKTLSSLRFALYHAQKYEKQRIFYAAPYNSILIQNAKEIRKAVGNSKYILEHHCNVQYENEASEEEYRKLTENWGDSLIVVTSAVQILNSLFSGQKTNIRRMYNLCNSVMVFDEVQAIPVSCIELFNLAVNFLTLFCNTTVVLCSATQPSLARLRENNLLNCEEMSGEAKKYQEVFRRVEIVDRTGSEIGGMSIENLKDFVLDSFRTYGSVLVIVNTRKTAYDLYEALEECVDNKALYHLSRNMCPEHQSDELEALKRDLEQKRPVICVSTQLVEAGVDFSFACVIRSLAGLDNVIQAAGRCNRHKELEGMGKVFIVKLSHEAENVDKLGEIRRAQSACERLLYEYEREPEAFQGGLTSQSSIKRYYELYFHKFDMATTKFPVPELETNLVNLLGENDLAAFRYERRYGKKMPKRTLKQAFQTAGEKFEVISENADISVIIPYNDIAKEQIAKLENAYTSPAEQRAALQILQRYTVGISCYKKEKLKNALHSISDKGILILNMDFYDLKKGILDRAKKQFLNF